MRSPRINPKKKAKTDINTAANIAIEAIFFLGIIITKFLPPADVYTSAGDYFLALLRLCVVSLRHISPQIRTSSGCSEHDGDCGTNQCRNETTCNMLSLILS